jgi:metallo-beta-lactamase class B
MRTTHAVSLALLLFAIPAFAPAQDRAGSLASDPAEGLARLRETLKWHVPAEPVKIAGPLYSVGTRGLGAWLIATREGLIVLNTGMPGSGPLIEASIRKLGMDPEEIEILLTCHAHVDHAGGLAYLQKLSGARVAMMAEEAPLMESGGKLDFRYGGIPAFAFEPVKVGQRLHDGDAIALGGVTLTARRTPGHTKGSTTYVMDVVEGAETYTVVFPDGTSVNPGYRLVKNPSYPGIADDYRRTFQVLDSLAPDIWLAPHPEVFDFEGKRARATTEGVAAWVDPDGYRRFVAATRAKFEAALEAE